MIFKKQTLPLLLSILISVVISKTDEDGLYNELSDNVLVLTGLNFDKHVLHEHVWLVEFYNRWCGHCIRFAPTFKSFAESIQGWHAVVRVGVVDCSEADNTKLCRDYDIDAYPTLKFFTSNGKTIESTKTLPAAADYNIMSLQTETINYLMDLPADHEPVNTIKQLKSLDDLWPQMTNKHKLSIILFEKDTSSILGAQIILDFSDCPELLIRRMFKEDIAQHKVEAFPSAYIVTMNGDFQRVAMEATDRESFVKVISKLVNTKSKFTPVSANPHEGDETVNQQLIKSDDRSGRVHMQDLESGLLYCFQQEIALKQSISADALTALKQFISALAEYFPGSVTLQTFLHRVDAWLQTIHSPITGEQWVTKISDLQDSEGHLPDGIEWAGCSGSEAKYRGYPCSLWTLFHVLTVSAYRKHNHDGSTPPRAVLYSVVGYMKNFFGCGECRKNFLGMAPTMEAQVHSAGDAVLWLWRSHNRANKRLHSDISEDPQHMKIQFPDQAVCPLCYGRGSSPEEPKFDEKRILTFLVESFYNEDSIIPVGSDIVVNVHVHPPALAHDVVKMMQDNQALDWWELQQKDADLKKVHEFLQKHKDNFHKDTGISRYNKLKVYQRSKELRSASMSLLAFSKVDLSLCIALWFVSIVIVILVYFHIMVRRRWPRKLIPI